MDDAVVLLTFVISLLAGIITIVEAIPKYFTIFKERKGGLISLCCYYYYL